MLPLVFGLRCGTNSIGWLVTDVLTDARGDEVGEGEFPGSERDPDEGSRGVDTPLEVDALPVFLDGFDRALEVAGHGLVGVAEADELHHVVLAFSE